MHIAIYDLDKTLTARATYTPFLLFAARQSAPWRLLLTPLWIMAMISYKLGIIQRDALKAFGMRLMTGNIANETLDQISRDFAQHHIMHGGFLPGSLQLLEEDREAGAKIILATAAFEFYAQHFAAMLNIETVIATRWDGMKIVGGNCYGARKKERFLKWLKAQNVQRDDMHIRFVSDSFADTPLLDYADDAIFNTANISASQRAKAKGWTVIDARYV